MEMQSFEKFFVNSVLWNWPLRWFFLPKLFKWVDAATPKNCLEVGCGRGVTTEEIVKRFPNFSLIAVDFDHDQVAKAAQRLAQFDNRINVQQGDATALSFADSQFDMVFACNVFHHIRDYTQALAEVYRVLKMDGKLYVMDIDFRTINPISRRLFPPEALFTREEFIRDLHAVGFREDATSGSRIFFVRARKGG
jgi:SAM-dependent methyltransferase